MTATRRYMLVCWFYGRLFIGGLVPRLVSWSAGCLFGSLVWLPRYGWAGKSEGSRGVGMYKDTESPFQIP